VVVVVVVVVVVAVAVAVVVEVEEEILDVVVDDDEANSLPALITRFVLPFRDDCVFVFVLHWGSDCVWVCVFQKEIVVVKISL
jgi:hypothetical protein